MRLISKDDAAKIKADPKAEVKTFYVEKCKGNTIPKHFMAEDNKDQKTLTINGDKVIVARNKERSEYCAFCTGTEAEPACFYVRDHSFIDNATVYVTFEKPVKPKPEPKPKKEKVAKPAKEAKAGKSTAASEKAARDAAAAAAGETSPDGDTGAA